MTGRTDRRADRPRRRFPPLLMLKYRARLGGCTPRRRRRRRTTLARLHWLQLKCMVVGFFMPYGFVLNANPVIIGQHTAFRTSNKAAAFTRALFPSHVSLLSRKHETL